MVEWITVPTPILYHEMLRIMENRIEEVINSQVAETVYLLEHQDVYTAGVKAKQEELLKSSYYSDIPVVYTGRGGRFTYHGPGQRVIYPIINLSALKHPRDIRFYIKMLETWIINSLLAIGVNAYAVRDRIGVWVKKGEEEAKIAAIGIRIKKWVTYHGIAINIAPDLDKFAGIIPCGLTDFKVTSLKDMKISITLSQFDEVLKKEFIRIFE